MELISFIVLLFSLIFVSSGTYNSKLLSGYFPLSNKPYDIKLLMTGNKDKRTKSIENKMEKLNALYDIMELFSEVEKRERYEQEERNNDFFWQNNNKRTPQIKLHSNLPEQACASQSITLSTYTLDRGTQSPNHVVIKECQGGLKNPENYQCQPTGSAIECFKTLNSKQNVDFLGIQIDTGCEEKCICARKECQNQKIEKLMCPLGFKENANTCLCEAEKGFDAKTSMLFRNRALYTKVWRNDINELCRKFASVDQTKRTIPVGKSFILKNINGIYQKFASV